MDSNFNPNTNMIIIPYIDLNNNDIYYHALPNITFIDKFIKNMFINSNERYNNGGIKRYNPLNYFICMNSVFKHNSAVIYLDEFEKEPQKRYKYNFNIIVDINYSFNEFKDDDKIEMNYVKIE